MTATRVLLYEFVTGGGWWSTADPQPPHGSLLAEGMGMVRALAQDLLASGSLELHVLADARLPSSWPDACQVHPVAGPSEERRQLAALAASCDHTILIAPEFDDLLAERARWVVDAGGSLLSPDPQFIALTANKTRLAEQLGGHGIPVPRSATWQSDQPLPVDLPWPVVLKPVDGAGSIDVQLVKSAAGLPESQAERSAWRLEAYHPGVPASVAVLCGPHQQLVLQPGQQILSTDGSFHYLGSSWPLSDRQQQRARLLAAAVIKALPATRGYVGIDLVLGDNVEGCDDVVIEVNPRLTTSYLGLRRLAKTNLATVMLRIGQGRQSTLAWENRPTTMRVPVAPLGAGACTG